MKINELPGSQSVYKLDAGEGLRFAFGNQLATVIARHADIGNPMAGATLTGARGATFPLHRHFNTHEAIYVLEGTISLILGDLSYLLTAGDYVNIPPGTPHGFTYLDHRGKMLAWTFGGNANHVYSVIGEPYAGTVYPETNAPVDWSKVTAATDTEILEKQPNPSQRYAEKLFAPPEGVAPFVIASGEGEQMIAGDQLYVFLGTQSNSGGTFIALITEGPIGTPIPRHYHETVTETFFCLNGALEMFAGDEYVTLHPGDYLHIPPRAVHSFQLKKHDTRFIGFVTPGIFEPFFRYLCEPYAGHVYPLVPPPFRFDRVLQHLKELDLVLLGGPGGPPPEAAL